MDILSKSDPKVVVFTEELFNNQLIYKMFGKTKCLKNELNPNFTKRFRIKYYFQRKQNIKFVV
jgi:hypothetical protein